MTDAFTPVLGPARGVELRPLQLPLSVGQRVAVACDIHTGFFEVFRGDAGEVVAISPDVIDVRMDRDLGPGGADWDNCLQVSSYEYENAHPSDGMTVELKRDAQARLWLAAI